MGTGVVVQELLGTVGLVMLVTALTMGICTGLNDFKAKLSMINLITVINGYDFKLKFLKIKSNSY